MDNETANLIVATSGVVVGVSALGIATWQGILARKNSRDSTRPNLEISIDAGSSHGIEIKIFNTGLGPAIITSSSFRLAGEEMEITGSGRQSIQILNAWQAQLAKFDIESIRREACSLPPESILRAGEKHILFSASSSDTATDESKLNKVHACLSEMQVTVHYQSFFGEKKSVSMVR